jgi:hypothetical protein
MGPLLYRVIDFVINNSTAYWIAATPAAAYFIIAMQREGFNQD